MTRIDFHANVADPCQYASRLLRKACGQGARVLVVADENLLTPMSHALWSLGDTEFLPHCASSDPAEMLQASPIVLHSAADALPKWNGTVLLNLSHGMPQGFESFDRLIEILPTAEQDPEGVAQGRQRWRHYKGKGYELNSYSASR